MDVICQFRRNLFARQTWVDYYILTQTGYSSSVFIFNSTTKKIHNVDVNANTEYLSLLMLRWKLGLTLTEMKRNSKIQYRPDSNSLLTEKIVVNWEGFGGHFPKQSTVAASLFHLDIVSGDFIFWLYLLHFKENSLSLS